MKLLDLHIDGFGKLAGLDVRFDERFNVVYGPNEAGKSTLETAVVALLYGVGRKDERDAWRPWNGAPYAGRLRYALADGRIFEVHRDFERDGKGARVFDEHGNDVSADVSVGKTVAPGQAHLSVPLEVFINAACVAQGSAEIDGARAERIGSALARALDGGPREDAALGAIARLDAALAAHVGTKRATINTPLRDRREELETTGHTAEEARARLRALDDLRARRDLALERRDELALRLREHELRTRAHRAQALRARLDSLRDLRDNLADLQEERARLRDVEDYAVGSCARLEERYREWGTAEALARAAAETAEASRLTPAIESELSERLHDGGALDQTTFAALQSDAELAAEARTKATFAASRAHDARRSVSGGNEVFGAAFAAGALVAMAAIVLAVVREWLFAAPAAALALALFAVAALRRGSRRKSLGLIAEMERTADAAAKTERELATRVAEVIAPLGVRSFDDFLRKRERARELWERRETARRNAARERDATAAANAAAAAFDALARTLGAPTGARDADLAAVRERERRRLVRDGIDAQLSMLEVRRGSELGDEDEASLERELAELLRAGVAPAPYGGSLRALEAERADLERRLADGRTAAAEFEAELRAAEQHVEDLAGLDERCERLRTECGRLERFETSLALAKRTIAERTREAHQQFARRLANYASATFGAITGGRYGDVRVDPTTLAIHVRAPETGSFVDLDRVSAGTREQAYLVVRLAMVRIFAEGIETAPLLLDDPFAHWDEERIERSFQVFESAHDVQTVLFTTQRAVAEAAIARGARLIDLSETAIVPARRRRTAGG